MKRILGCCVILSLFSGCKISDAQQHNVEYEFKFGTGFTISRVVAQSADIEATSHAKVELSQPLSEMLFAPKTEEGD